MSDIKKLFRAAYERYLVKVNQWNKTIEQMPLKQRLELILMEIGVDKYDKT